MVTSRVIIRVTPFRALISLLITHLLSPLGPLQVKWTGAARGSTRGLKINGSGLAQHGVQFHGWSSPQIGVSG